MWISEQELENLKKLNKSIEKNIIFNSINGFEKQDQRKLLRNDNLKWAWIKIGETRKMCWVDNETMKAYKADWYNKTNIEINNFTFERWCTSFDL